MASTSWENVVKDAPEMDGALLMALLDESHLEEDKDERLGCLIQSLEAEIEPSAVAVGNTNDSVEMKRGNYMDCGLENVGLDGDDCSRSTCHIDDPFDWMDMSMDMDMVANSRYDSIGISNGISIGNWYLESNTNNVGMIEFEDVRDYSPFYYEETSMEHAYSPLWHEI